MNEGCTMAGAAMNVRRRDDRTNPLSSRMQTRIEKMIQIRAMMILVMESTPTMGQPRPTDYVAAGAPSQHHARSIGATSITLRAVLERSNFRSGISLSPSS
jgi:hypothetical protein